MQSRLLNLVGATLLLSTATGCPDSASGKAPGELAESAPEETDCTPEEEIPYDAADQDCDGSDLSDVDGDGYAWVGVEGGSDCDDDDPDVSPNATEVCDGQDNDCDGAVPSDEVDEDGDSQMVCGGDCDDAEALARTGGVELCEDGIDNDCEGTADGEDCTRCDTMVLDGSGSDLQGAVDAAISGDVICVGPGSWSYLVFGGAEVSVIGLLGPEKTSLTMVFFDAAETSSTVLRGFTITGGSGYGGGCVDIEGASPTLADLVVEECGGFYAGGIYVNGGSPSFTNMIIRNNNAYDGGGYASSSSGGGFGLYDADVLLDDVTVHDNMAETSGGGIYVDGGSLALFNVVVRGNEGGGWGAYPGSGGGGLCVYNATLELENVLLLDNTSGSRGGGVLAYDSELTLTNVIVVDNDAAFEGGGMKLVDSEVTLTNTSVSGNSAGDELGGGIFLNGGSLSITYGDIWGNEPDDVRGLTDPAGTDGNVSVDPDFLDDTYHLSTTSALIDAGDPTILDPDGSPSDIGAFGGPGAASWDLDGDGYASWWLPGAYDAATSPDADCDDEDADVYPGNGC